MFLRSFCFFHILDSFPQRIGIGGNSVKVLTVYSTLKLVIFLSHFNSIAYCAKDPGGVIICIITMYYSLHSAWLLCRCANSCLLQPLTLLLILWIDLLTLFLSAFSVC